MENEKKIQLLLSENEFLQQQLEDLNEEIQKKDAALTMLGEMSESEASLRSRIDSNLTEIEQLRYNSEQAAQKSLAMEQLNEELEISLLKEIKGRQQEQAVIKQLSSVSTNIDILNEELDGAAALYKKVQSLKKELAAANSLAELKTLENEHLLAEIIELKALLRELKGRNISNK